MPRPTHAIAVLVTVLVVVAGCRTITGRSAGQWIEDKTTMAKVKAAVASAQIGTMTRVDVDTSNGTIYLTGVTGTDSERQRIVEAARTAAAGKRVASNLVVSTGKRDQAAADDETEPSALPRATTAQPGQPHLASAALPPPTPLKFGRLEAEAPALGRFAAYDEDGRRVATLYRLSASELRDSGITTLQTGDRRIDHVSIYPHPSAGDPEYVVVLWHVNRQQARSLE